MTEITSSKSRAIFLGLCSLATQAVYLRFILSSETGGELYAALALGGWLLWVAIGSFIGKRISWKFSNGLWLLSAIVKIPIALLIFIYPAFFTGILDPLQFLPLALLGLALPGIIYGIIFALLISPGTKTSLIYRNEAIGSFMGGLIVTLWAFLGLGDFGLLIFLSLVEISCITRHRAFSISIAAIGLIMGTLIYPSIDRLSIKLRWPGYDIISVSHGLSGQWAALSREGQTTVIHSGTTLGSIPDREISEEALLWPLLFKPQSRNMLLVGFEGLQVDKYLPVDMSAVRIVNDPAYLKVNIGDSTPSEIGDILSYHPNRSFDIINIQLHGASTLYYYRMETELFFARCKTLLKDDGILFVSAPADENYISPELAKYLSSLRNSLKRFFPTIVTIPGPRVGFVCFQKVAPANQSSDILANLSQLRLSSPYFNQALITNRLLPLKLASLESAIEANASPNSLIRPASVYHYLKWQGSQFGKKDWVFNIYNKSYVMIMAIAVFLTFVFLNFGKGGGFKPFSAVSAFGFLGMALEIVVLYMFQMLFGTLFLHIGMIMAVFMLGMAIGSASKINPHTIVITLILPLILIMLVPVLSNSEIGLLIAGGILYIGILIIGFSTGGGFAFVANHATQDGDKGPALYGSDLAGAALAVIIIPGVMISMGTFSLLLALILLSLLNYAALVFDKSW